MTASVEQPWAHSFDPLEMQVGDSKWCERCGARVSRGWEGFELAWDPLGRDDFLYLKPPFCAGRKVEILWFDCLGAQPARYRD